MANVKIVLNSKGVRELLKSDEVRQLCREEGNGVMARCGSEHYEIADRNYPERCGVAIYPIDYEGVRDNLKNNTLLKAVR